MTTRMLFDKFLLFDKFPQQFAALADVLVELVLFFC